VVTTQPPSEGLSREARWRVLRQPAPGTHRLYECATDDLRSFISKDEQCEGHPVRSAVGFVFSERGPGAIELFRCSVLDREDRFVSSDRSCEGQRLELSLGYAFD
jgi:hypothetical protein